jgi:hypothetical protein
VVAPERVCPFCGAAVRAGSVRTVRLAGRLSRAAVFAGLTASCWSGNEATQRHTPPPPPPPDDAAQVVDQAPPPGTAAALGGVVREAGTNVPLANVTVELRDATGRIAATTTDERGNYAFWTVAPGDYQLVVKYSSYDAVGSTQRPVMVRDEAAQVDVALPLAHRAPIAKPYGAPPARRRIV